MLHDSIAEAINFDLMEHLCRYIQKDILSFEGVCVTALILAPSTCGGWALTHSPCHHFHPVAPVTGSIPKLLLYTSFQSSQGPRTPWSDNSPAPRFPVSWELRKYSSKNGSRILQNIVQNAAPPPPPWRMHAVISSIHLNAILLSAALATTTTVAVSWWSGSVVTASSKHELFINY